MFFKWFWNINLEHSSRLLMVLDHKIHKSRPKSKKKKKKKKKKTGDLHFKIEHVVSCVLSQKLSGKMI